jgi:small conductance mechanosensitive channel
MQEFLNTVINWATHTGVKIIIALVILFIAFKVINFVAKKFTKKFQDNPKFDKTLTKTFIYIGKIALKILVVICLIGYLGIETSGISALIASVGVAAGLAINGTLANLAGGVMILVTRPFKVDDFIEAQGYSGTVNQIQIFSTILTTVDNQTIIIPNGGLATSSLKNYSKQPYRRVDIDVEVAYGSKPDVVRKVLLDICLKDSRIMTQDAMKPFIPMTSMGASAIAFQVRVWTESANYWGVKFDTTEKIYNRLAEEGIEIPFQQIDVHMRS